MSRIDAIKRATVYFNSGRYQADLARRVHYATESKDPRSGPILRAYLSEAIIPDVAALGFVARIVENPVSPQHPFLIAHRSEGNALKTVLIYGHGDVQPAHAEQWRTGLDPWNITVEDDRWYGRGSADNKGQHTVNLGTLGEVIEARRGRLGYNVTLILDMGEECGSPGLVELAEQNKNELSADILIASDGPRLAANRPTVYLGSRGCLEFTLACHLRDGGQHSGNWGGVIANAATIIANAIASLIDHRGRIQVPELRSPQIPDLVRDAIGKLSVDASPTSPAIDVDWGEPGLTPEEKLFGANNLEVLAMIAGDPDMPVGAVPGFARAHCELRFVAGADPDRFLPAIRTHLDAHGFARVELVPGLRMNATRTATDHPWVQWISHSIQATTGQRPGLIPNLAGSIPNEAFADVLGIPTIWIPHSYPGCSQHAANEHALGSLMQEACQIMAGIWWDLGDAGDGARTSV